MTEQEVANRINGLLTSSDSGADPQGIKSRELFNGALSAMVTLYGPTSPQVQMLAKDGELLRSKFYGAGLADELFVLARGAIQNLKAELDAGFVGSLQRSITSDVLTDFLQLARIALDEKGDDAKNVAAVLAAALYEDTIRRLASANAIPHLEKLQDVITALKDSGILQGPQVGIAISYLKFRNDSLHAQWTNIGRESVVSVLGFVEQLLLKHFG